MENKPAPTMREPKYEPPRFRSRSTRIGKRGLATLSSILTNARSKKRATTKNARVDVFPQPLVAARLNP